MTIERYITKTGMLLKRNETLIESISIRENLIRDQNVNSFEDLTES